MAIKIDRTAFATTLASKAKLVPHLERAIGEGDFVWQFEYEPKKGDDAWHPSGDCTPSLHELWLKATGKLEGRPFTASSYKNFMVGHFWHAYLQWIVEKKLEFCGPEAIERKGSRVWATEYADCNMDCGDTHKLGCKALATKQKPYHWATGSGDIAPVDIPSHGEFLVDFKTMNTREYAKCTATKKLPGWCADKYECQANIYMDFFDTERTLILAIDKNTPHDMMEFEFHRNQELIDAIYAKWELVSQCLDEGIEIPEGEDIYLPTTGPVTT